MNRFKSSVRYFAVGLCALLCRAQGLLAQSADGGAWSEATEGVLSLYSGMAKLLRAVILIGALVVLADIIIKLMSGDKDSARRLLWWLFGLVIGFVMLELLSGAI